MMNENLVKTEETVKVLRAMIEVLSTALEGKSDISVDTLMWYTNEMLSKANEIAD